MNSMAFRRMLPFILINVLVSASTVFGILWWWERRETTAKVETTATAVAFTPLTSVATPGLPTAEEASQEETAVEPEPSPMPIHIVRSGDTLMSISQFYNVPMDDIIAINDLDNPNLLSIGQELIIPIGGIPTPTPVPTAPPLPTAIPTPNPTIPAQTSGEAILRITGVTGVGNLTEEGVQIVNEGSGQIGMRGWTLRDEDGFVYTFDLFTLFGSGSGVVIHTETGTNSATDLYWGLEQPVWRAGERVTLLDAQGNIRATYVIP